MKTTVAVALSALVASVAAKPATQFTKAQWEKYHCLTLEKYIPWTPPCVHNCLMLGLTDHRDGCAPDDHVCHCKHTWRADEIVIPCLTTPGSPNATCKPADIDKQIGIIADLCGFYNATGYADYIGCDAKLTEEVIEDITGLHAPEHKSYGAPPSSY